MSTPAEHTARIASLFDAVAPTYDQVGVDFFGPIARSLLRCLTPSAGEHWLDVGCGRGAVLLPAAEAIGPTGRVVGIDISPRMIESVRNAATAADMSQVHVMVGDAATPDVESGSFDTISSSAVLFFLTDPAAAVSAWLPLLRPGGRLGITTFGSVDVGWAHVDAAFAPYLPPAMVDARTTGGRGPFASDAGMETLVTDAGFIDVGTVTEDIPVRFADADQWHDFTWSVGQRQMWLAVPEAERPTVRAEAVRRLNEISDTDGSITVHQGIRHTLARRPA